MKLLKRRISRVLKEERIDFEERKIFCIGFNKTGTTSINATMQNLGYVIGDQGKGEKLLLGWKNRDFSNIIKLAKSAEFFQDVPFSLPFTYIPLHLAFPKAKFILTVRNDSEEWYQSVCRFHAKLWSKNEQPPTVIDLKSALYGYEGMPYDFNRWVYHIDDQNPYDKERLIQTYENHNKDVNYYFSNNPNFIQVNVGVNEDYFRMCKFLGIEPKEDGFRWLNKT